MCKIVQIEEEKKKPKIVFTLAFGNISVKFLAQMMRKFMNNCVYRWL